jgi:signal peptidase
LFGVNRRKQKRKEKSHSLNNTTQHKLVAAEAERRRRRIIHQQQHSESQSQAMGFVGDTVDSIKSLQIRQVLHQGVSLGMIVTSALIIWKALMCITGSESPVVVVLSGSMEPGFKRGDILFLHMSKDPIRTGEIVVFNVDGREIPIVHRVIKVHERGDTGEVDVLTKGDNNYGDDRLLYAHGQLWLQRHHIMGRAVGFLPYVGWVTIIMTEKPIIKYILIGALGLLVITSKE